MSDEMNRCVWPLGECTNQDRIEEAAFQRGVQTVRAIAVGIARNGFKAEREGAKAVLEEIRELKREVKNVLS